MKEITAILAHTLPDAQHAMAEVKLGTRGGFSIFSRKSPPLTRLWKNKHITFEQRIAGERLEELAHTAGIYAPTGMALGERTSGGGGRSMSERQLEAWQEYFRACKEVTRQMGNDVTQTVTQVAVYGYSPMQTRSVAINRRMTAVRDGLQIVHDFLFTPRELTASI
jgi:hypothetical protein